MEELKTLFSENKVIEIAGTKITIKEAEVQHLPLVLSIAEKLVTSFKGQGNTEVIASIMGSVSKDFKLVLELIEKLTDIPKDKVPKLNLAASTAIVKNIIEVNLDFLHLHLKPILSQFSDLQKKYNGIEKSKG